jgi:hypothetical protein
MKEKNAKMCLDRPKNDLAQAAMVTLLGDVRPSESRPAPSPQLPTPA